jgi:hypothetical protein
MVVDAFALATLAFPAEHDRVGLIERVALGAMGSLTHDVTGAPSPHILPMCDGFQVCGITATAMEAFIVSPTR